MNLRWVNIKCLAVPSLVCWLLQSQFLNAGVYESQQRQYYAPHKFQSRDNAEGSHKRVIELMRSYYEEAHSRLAFMNPIRFMYEESPYYEMGYVTGEIIERYRKVLEHAQRPIRFKSMTLFDILKRAEFVQKLYFELYHLVRMMHEIPKKWSSVFEFKNIEAIASPDIVTGLVEAENATSTQSLDQLHEAENQLKEMEKRRAKERRRKRKEYERIREIYMKNFEKVTREVKKYNIIWPIDYGWEIDYKW